jgi:hypothetical protein
LTEKVPRQQNSVGGFANTIFRRALKYALRRY